MDYVIFFDVQVTHPNFNDSEHRNPLKGAIMESWTRKKQLYTDNYKIRLNQIEPMVFDTFGAWHAATINCLFKLVTRAATRSKKVNKVLREDLWRDLRYRIAVTLVSKQHRVVEHFNWRLKEFRKQTGAPLAGNTGTTSNSSSAPAMRRTVSPGEQAVV